MAKAMPDHEGVTAFRTRIQELQDAHDLNPSQAYMLANAESNAHRLAPFRLPGIARDEHPFVQGADGLWHVRKDDFWDNDIAADVRAHTVCGDVWSCHISSVPPSLLAIQASERRHCRECFPTGRPRV